MLLILYSRDSIKAMSAAIVTCILIYTILPLLLDVSAIVLNGLIAYVLKKHKKTDIMTFWFIYCLSLSDILVGVSGLIYESMWLIWSLGFRNSSWRLIDTCTVQLHHFFFETSGQLIVIIAVDRYIHMKYLNKYSGIMTQSRARLIMLFSIVFGVVVIIPFNVLSIKHRALYSLCINTVRATGALMACVLYVKTYFTIRSKLAALQIGKRDCTDPSHKLEATCQCQNVQYCRDFSKENLCVAYDSFRRSSTSHLGAQAEGASNVHPENNAFILPCGSSTSQALRKQKYTMEIRCVSRSVECNICDHVADLNANVGEGLELRKASKAKGQGVQVKQKIPARESAPEQGILKATMLIFLALLICYTPFFFNKFYTLATNNWSFILDRISYMSVLLNSSLNAILLIACNKEMKRNIKAIFVARKDSTSQ